MPLAGETIIAGKIPGERIATAISTTNSAAVTTTETVVMTVISPVIIGRIYRVRGHIGFDTSVAGDVQINRIREDSLAGNQLTARRFYHPTTAGSFTHDLEAEYTADATESKTFVFTIIRESGTGSLIMVNAANAPSYFYVDYIRG